MLSYIFMKILESRPHRYDCGINLLTGGQASRSKGDIVRNFVRPGMAVLDVGCGTGDLAVRAAQVGAFVTGVDISEAMLAVARERIKQNGLENKVVLHHAGVVEIDTLFDENSFDLITSTLVISELYGEERAWAFRELYRILKSDGTLLVAGEVRPKHLLKRVIYYALRLPLALITYFISQTGSKPVKDIGIEKALRGQSCYLLVAQTKGINVWCASAGGEMNTHSIITALKTSGMGERVDHRELILPQFSAPGIDTKLLKKVTGWKGKWGPAYAGDLPTFFSDCLTKTQELCRARFPLSFRMEMLLAMNVLPWLIFAAIALAVHPLWAIAITLIFWGAGMVLYSGYYLLPFRSGWLKALTLSAAAAAVFVGMSVHRFGSPWHYAGWMIFASLGILTIGFDLKGIVGDRTSEAEAFMYGLGFDTFGNLFQAKGFHKGNVTQSKSIDPDYTAEA